MASPSIARPRRRWRAGSSTSARRMNLYAFDAAGISGCAGSPRVCTPLWTAPTGGFITSSAAVVDGIVYVRSQDGNLYAFDAAGVSGCAGVPRCARRCGPRPTGSVSSSSPTVADGVVYIGSSNGDLYAFDAAGASGCAGTPKVLLAALDARRRVMTSSRRRRWPDARRRTSARTNRDQAAGSRTGICTRSTPPASRVVQAPESVRHSGSRIRGRRSLRRRSRTGSSISARPSAGRPTGSDSPRSMPRPATRLWSTSAQAASTRPRRWPTASSMSGARTEPCTHSTRTASAVERAELLHGLGSSPAVRRGRLRRGR